VENLRCESEFHRAHPADEQHAWVAIGLDAVQNAWVRRVTAAHFAGSAVSLLESCKWVTVQDCASIQPVSEIGGYRRHTYYTSGQLTLFLRCRSERGRHDFAAGYLAAGPNAFVECEATAALDFSGPIESWASGVLFDNVTVDGGGLALTNRETDGQGVGWAAANCVLWQCVASVITCRNPPGARNWAIGCWGQFYGDGCWQMPNEFVKPVSLFRGQLAERLRAKAVAALDPPEIPSQPGDARPIEALVRRPFQIPGFLIPEGNPAKQLLESGILEFGMDSLLGREPPPKTPSPIKPLAVRNGWLVCAGELLIGGRIGTTWWRGSVLPTRAREFGAGLTRFVPGRDGPGFTDDLDRLTDSMLQTGKAALEHHWGLWYDRRRDDHQMVRRADGDVWPPFYEQPWARSGQGTAWDGLSRYDLESFNPWYFDRLRQFATLCDRKGLALIHQAYFQHNILEAGAHWADFPWRPANCLQATGFPEPPPYANKKRIFMADAFYDIKHPVRRPLHRLYIRHCLDTLGGCTNVIYLTGEEYTGPLEFVQFWIDTITAWERETGKDVLIGLSSTKDVQDAILADPVRGPAVSVIELKYWWYTADGTLYAPEGGRSLAPRQQLREWRGPKKRSIEQTARQIREYRNRYPDKAILFTGGPADGWAVLTAGGSLPDLPRPDDPRLLRALPRMRPFEPAGRTDRQWALAEPGQNYLVYAGAGAPIRLDLTTDQGVFHVLRINPRTGRTIPDGGVVSGGKVVEFPAEGPGPVVLWLTRYEGGPGPVERGEGNDHE
ncbi:MAG: pectate lyase, partial [Isosphaeraceae bacterium]|nr:pectate lyase [Isosphaeraceae bacterium]